MSAPIQEFSQIITNEFHEFFRFVQMQTERNQSKLEQQADAVSKVFRLSNDLLKKSEESVLYSDGAKIITEILEKFIEIKADKNRSRKLHVVASTITVITALWSEWPHIMVRHIIKTSNHELVALKGSSKQRNVEFGTKWESVLQAILQYANRKKPEFNRRRPTRNKMQIFRLCRRYIIRGLGSIGKT